MVLVNRTADRAEALAGEIAEAGGAATVFAGDMTSAADADAMVGAAEERYGRLDILVNNVGIGGPGTAEQVTEEDWDLIIGTNLKSAMLATRAALPAMKRAGGGSIINISSICGIVGSFANAAYHASKGAVRIFSKAAAIQYAAENIRVNSVHPGFVDTPMTAPGHANPEVAAKRMEATPMGRFGTPHDIAMGCLYLASDESAWMTGAELVIDGGMTAN